METYSNKNRRARMTGRPAARQASARLAGAASWRVVCPSALGINPGGRLDQLIAFRPEGSLFEDSHQLQN
jgi:hypothetical protein